MRILFTLLKYSNVRSGNKTFEMLCNTVRKKKFFIEDFFSKFDRISPSMQIWSHLLKKFLMENFIFVECKNVIRGVKIWNNTTNMACLVVFWKQEQRDVSLFPDLFCSNYKTIFQLNVLVISILSALYVRLTHFHLVIQLYRFVYLEDIYNKNV